MNQLVFCFLNLFLLLHIEEVTLLTCLPVYAGKCIYLNVKLKIRSIKLNMYVHNSNTYTYYITSTRIILSTHRMRTMGKLQYQIAAAEKEHTYMLQQQYTIKIVSLASLCPFKKKLPKYIAQILSTYPSNIVPLVHIKVI